MQHEPASPRSRSPLTATEPPSYTYTAAKPPLPWTLDQLTARIPGWGVDRDPADRPSARRLLPVDHDTGAHWTFPERMPGGDDRERSVEHAFVTPVFGTAQPLHGLSGSVRRLAYARFSEARLTHWLLLIAGDRLDATEQHLRSVASRRPDNPITETGIRSELTHHGWRSRRGARRGDVAIQAIDPVLVAGPWLLALWGLWRGGGAVRRRLR